MTVGLSVLTGASSKTKVSITDQDIPPGLWLDYFTVAKNQTITKTYAPTSATISIICTITITDMTVVIKNQGSTLAGAGTTAAQITVNELSAISANLGTLVTYKDPAQPLKARMVMQGSLITVYDDNNKLRVKLGVW